MGQGGSVGQHRAVQTPEQLIKVVSQVARKGASAAAGEQLIHHAAQLVQIAGQVEAGKTQARKVQGCFRADRAAVRGHRLQRLDGCGQQPPCFAAFPRSARGVQCRQSSPFRQGIALTLNEVRLQQGGLQ